MKGFTFIEAIVAVAIIVVLSAVVFYSLPELRDKKTLESGAVGVVSLLEEARQMTLASIDGKNYGVHFESGAAVRFAGATYSAGDPGNFTLSLDPLIEISAINLSGGGSEVVFERITGAADKSGTVETSLVADPTQKKTIRIEKTGLATIQIQN